MYDPVTTKPTIREAKEPDLSTVRQLYRSYAQEFSYSICFEGFEAEVQNLPGEYAVPSGALLIATLDDLIVGTVALRGLPNGFREMKRLFVVPAQRKAGIGRLLVEAAIQVAKQQAALGVRLDTLPEMVTAQRLYETLGLTHASQYEGNCCSGTGKVEKKFMELRF